GAMMLIAVFMAVFLVGCLWYVIGVGDAAIYREKMQDASDAVTYVSAVYHARGMNVIACMNMVIAAFVAVIIALKLILVIITVGQIIAGALCVCPFSAAIACPVEGALSAIRSEVKEIADAYESVEKEVVQALTVAQTGIAKAVPFIAATESLSY